MAVDVTRQPRSEQYVSVDLFNPAIQEWLRRRVPRAEAREAAELAATGPKALKANAEDMNDLYKSLVDLIGKAQHTYDVSVEQLGGANKAEASRESAFRRAAASENVAATTQAGLNARQMRAAAQQIVNSANLQTGEGEKLDQIDGMVAPLWGKSSDFTTNANNVMAQLGSQIQPIIATSKNDIHTGAVVRTAIANAKKGVRSGDRVGYNSLSPDEKAAFNAATERMLSSNGIAFSVGEDGEPQINALTAADDAAAKSSVAQNAQTTVYAGGRVAPQPVTTTTVTRTAPAAGAASPAPAATTTAPTATTTAPAITQPAAAPSVPASTGNTAADTQQILAAGGVPETGDDGMVYFVLPNGARILDPAYVAALQQPGIKFGVKMLTDRMDELRNERAKLLAAQAKGAGIPTVSLDLNDRTPHPLQDKFDEAAGRWATMSEEDRAKGRQRLAALAAQMGASTTPAEAKGKADYDAVVARDTEGGTTVGKGSGDTTLAGVTGRLGDEPLPAEAAQQKVRALNKEWNDTVASLRTRQIAENDPQWAKEVGPIQAKMSEVASSIPDWQGRRTFLEQLPVPTEVRTSIATSVAQADLDAKKAREATVAAGNEDLEAGLAATAKDVAKSKGSEDVTAAREKGRAAAPAYAALAPGKQAETRQKLAELGAPGQAAIQGLEQGPGYNEDSKAFLGSQTGREEAAQGLGVPAPATTGPASPYEKILPVTGARVVPTETGGKVTGGVVHPSPPQPSVGTLDLGYDREKYQALYRAGLVRARKANPTGSEEDIQTAAGDFADQTIKKLYPETANAKP